MAMAIAGGVVAAAGGGGVLWMRRGHAVWETEAEAVRRAIAPGAPASENVRTLVRAATELCQPAMSAKASTTCS